VAEFLDADSNGFLSHYFLLLTSWSATDGPTKDGKLLVSPWTAKEESERKRWAEPSSPPLFFVGSLMYFLSWKNEKKFNKISQDTQWIPLYTRWVL
jgi:hypothetical protein